MNLVKFYVFKMIVWINLPAVYAHHSITMLLFNTYTWPCLARLLSFLGPLLMLVA